MKSVSVLGLVWLVVGCSGTSFLGDGVGTGGGVNGQGGSAGALGSGGSGGAWSQCAGLACGTICNVAACPPNEPCALLYAEGHCDQNGACTQNQPQCTAEDPCAGKACGDECNRPCPSGQSCPTVLGYCSESGDCNLAYPVCSGTCQVASDCPAPPPTCEQCPDGSSVCTVASCVNGQCAYTTPACPDDPCAGKACGDTCTPPCPSGQACPTVLGYCSESGDCTLAYPVCNSGTCQSDADCPAVPTPPCGQCPDGSTVCTGTSCVNGQCGLVTPACPSDPCAGKACGDTCVPPCPSGQACPTVMGYCGENGTCTLAYPVCSTGKCQLDTDCPPPPPSCDQCPDGGASCPTATCVNGQCATVTPGCPNHSPCAGKACGDACSPCNPADPACVVPTTKPMYCNANLGCQMGEPACGTGYGSCSTVDDCPRLPYPCRLCGGSGTTPPCGSLTCLGGSCLLACPL